MTRGKLDITDALMSPLFVISSAVGAGIISFAPYGFDISEPLLTLGSGAGAITLTLAKIISIAVVLAAFITNRPDFEAFTAVETWVVVATLGLILAPPFSPALENFIQASYITGSISVIIQSGGYYSLAYLG